MLNSVKELSASVIIILVGAAMVIIGAANPLTIGGNAVQISNEWKVVIIITGGVLLLLGVYLVWRESSSGKGAKSPAKATTISHMLRSGNGTHEHRPFLHFANASTRTIKIFWIDSGGMEQPRGKEIPPGGGIHTEHTFSTHPFLVKDASTEEQLLVVIPRNQTDMAVTISIEDSNGQ